MRRKFEAGTMMALADRSDKNDSQKVLIEVI